MTSDDTQPDAPAPTLEHLDQQRRKAVEWAASRWPSLNLEAKAEIGDPARRHRLHAGYVETAPTVPAADPPPGWSLTPEQRAAMQADLANRVAAKKLGLRVDAWLEAHAAWLDASPDRQRLRTQWLCVAQWFGPDSDPARGVLLGLVRLAWGASFASSHRWVDSIPVAPDRWIVCGRLGDTEVEALLAALEAAPC